MNAGGDGVRNAAAPPEPLVSICVVTGSRIPALRTMLESLRAQVDAPPFEVLVVGTASPEVVSVVLEYFEGAKVGLATAVYLGGARNFLLSVARGEWLYFLDDDVVCDPAMLRSLADLARDQPGIGVFGGPNENPPGSSLFQRAQGAVLGSLAGSGPVRRRYTPHRPAPAKERDLILCNLAVRRAAMVPFDPSLSGGEENGLLSELAQAGVAMRYEPALAVSHERRPDLRSFAVQMHKYGRGRGQILPRRPRTLLTPFMLPVALLAYLVALPPLAWVSLWSLAPLAVYLGWISAGALKVAVGFSRHRGSAFGLSLVILPVVHLAYGLGVLRGLGGRHGIPESRFRWIQGVERGPEPERAQSDLAPAID